VAPIEALHRVYDDASDDTTQLSSRADGPNRMREELSELLGEILGAIKSVHCSHSNNASGSADVSAPTTMNLTPIFARYKAAGAIHPRSRSSLEQ
jgi:hypothetical protein